MRKRNYKGKCVKVSIEKCQEVCRTYDAIQLAAVKKLQEDESIAEIMCNIPLSDPEVEDYMTDIICKTVDGEIMVRECVFRRLLTKPMTVRLLDKSRIYWLRQGIKDWGIVIDAEK